MKRLWIGLGLLLGVIGIAWTQQISMPPPAGVTVMSCVYNSSQPVLSDGTPGLVQCDANGNIGGGGSGGAVTIADGADVTQGAKADSVCATATGTCTISALIKFLNTVASSAIPAGTNRIGYVSDDPCQTIAKTFTPISITTNTTTRIVAPTAAKKTYICYLFITSAAADNIGIVEGTGGTCGAGTAGVIGGTTAANGPNFPANGGMSIGNGGFAIAATAGTNVDLCLITSAATPLAGTIAWVQAP